MPDATWSLTRRMALRFALVTSALLALYALGSAWVLHRTQHEEVDDFFEHELKEYALELSRTDGSPLALEQATEVIAQVGAGLPCGFRVFDLAGGMLLAQAGRVELFDQDVRRDAGPGRHVPWVFGSPILSRRAAVPGHPLFVEIVVDAGENQARLYRYLAWAGTTWLLFVGLAALTGWYTAWRGLRSLREMARQAREIQAPQPGAAIQLDGAPRELRELGGELNAMLERIEAGLSSMRTFTAGLAHELRSPLQNLMGETEVALLSEREPAEYVRLLRSNLDDLHALSDAVDNLIAWCRSSEPGHSRGALEIFDFAHEARIRLERDRRSAERAGVSLRVSSSGETRVLADREGSLRVLRNLVSNAIAWSPPGGTIDVRIDGDGRGLCLTVEDEGPGIPPELADRIFEPFVTGRPRKGERGGYGLGLAICRSVMQQHGGSLVHENRSGRGTRFLARFPRAAPRGPSGPAERTTDGSGTTGHPAHERVDARRN